MQFMNDIADWLTLYRVSGVGPATYNKLIGLFGSPREVMARTRRDLLEAKLPAALIEALAQPDRAGVADDLAWLQQSTNHHIITQQDSTYPALLRELTNDAPPLLFVKGNVNALNSPQIAIVGSRNPSPSGKENAYAYAKELATHNLTVTSGLALGIDAASHLGTLSARGCTIAVCATGLDSVYPKSHGKLAAQILECHGALVSEFPIGYPAKREHFPRRNRIISGMALGTLVVEAALQSGSLITARFAAEQGREVFAIPGSVHNPLAKGCHALIKQGAKLTESAQDILEEIPFLRTTAQRSSQTFQESLIQPINLTGEQWQVYRQLDFAPTPIDSIIERSGLPADVVCSTLTELELQRYITSTPGGFYSRER